MLSASNFFLRKVSWDRTIFRSKAPTFMLREVTKIGRHKQNKKSTDYIRQTVTQAQSVNEPTMMKQWFFFHVEPGSLVLRGYSILSQACLLDKACARHFIKSVSVNIPLEEGKHPPDSILNRQSGNTQGVNRRFPASLDDCKCRLVLHRLFLERVVAGLYSPAALVFERRCDTQRSRKSFK